MLIKGESIRFILGAMTVWGKIYRWLYVASKCVMCKSPLKGQRVDTCSPNCDAWRERMASW